MKFFVYWEIIILNKSVNIKTLLNLTDDEWSDIRKYITDLMNANKFLMENSLSDGTSPERMLTVLYDELFVNH